MILIILIIIPILGGLVAWYAGRSRPVAVRVVSLAALALDLLLVLAIWLNDFTGPGSGGTGGWNNEVNLSWVPALGIRFHLGIDGFSLLLVVLALFLGLLSIISSWTEINDRVGFFHLNVLWTLAGIIGVFLALDLLLFYFFWELMLLPMFLLIALWGHEKRKFAAMKFLLFTQAGGLLMLLAILGLYLAHGRNTGSYTFDYMQLLGTPLSSDLSYLLMILFFLGFAVKLPAVPLHTWLPDAHTEAPTAGSVILAGLLLKTGAYGLIRFLIPLFPAATTAFSGTGMAVGVAGILYGAVLSFGQRDFKRLVAYTSISHMGFVLLGVFAGNELGRQGAIMQIICHGIATGGLFILAGMLQERLHTRELDRMGGFWATMPKLGGIALILALASLGLPGLGNFVGEFLVLLGAYQVNPVMAAAGACGLVLSAVYSLWLVQKVFFGTVRESAAPDDLSLRELLMFGVMIASLLVLGLYPRPVLKTAGGFFSGNKTTPSIEQGMRNQQVTGRTIPGHPEISAGAEGGGLP